MNEGIENFSQAINAVKDFETIKESDKTLALLPKVFRALLSEVEIWALNRQYRVAETAKLLTYKLQNIDPSKIIDPPIHVAVPALQALSYSFDSKELQEMYANLLAKAMNSDFTESVHPGFIEIIKQMSPLDAILLKKVAELGSEPYINLRFKAKSGTLTILQYYLSYSINEYDPRNVAVSISNLVRLGLFNDPQGTYFANTTIYNPLENSPYINLQINNFKNSYEGDRDFIGIECEKRRVDITPYGQNFVSVCLE